jgi:hypothetical protein
LCRLTSDLVEVNEKICEPRIGSGEIEVDLKTESLAGQLAREAAVEVDALLGCGASVSMDFEAIETGTVPPVLRLAWEACSVEAQVESGRQRLLQWSV